MKMLKRILALALLCAIVPTQAQEQGIDQSAYQANPGCQVKITVRAGETKYPLNYRVTFNGSAVSVQGTLDANGVGEILLPASHQWYDLFIERAEADKALYAVESGCDTSGGMGVLAPAPILNEAEWATAQQMLVTFVQQRQGSSTAPTVSTSVQGVCTISTRASSIRMRAGHSTSAAVVGNLPRNTQFQVIDRFVESIGQRTRTWYRIAKEAVAPTSDAAEIWVGGSVRTSGCGTAVIGSSPAAPAAAVVNAVLPQSGAWTLTYGSTVSVSCNNAGSVIFSTSGALNQMIFNSQIASAGSGFVFDGVGYSQDASGTWHGISAAPSVQATGEALIRVDTSTRILGDLLISSSTIPNCTFKFPFWAAPK